MSDRSVKLGRIGFKIQGEYNSAQTYRNLDIVTHNGCVYVATGDVVVNSAPGISTMWTKLLDKYTLSVNAAQNKTGNIVQLDSDGGLSYVPLDTRLNVQNAIPDSLSVGNAIAKKMDNITFNSDDVGKTLQIVRESMDEGITYAVKVGLGGVKLNAPETPGTEDQLLSIDADGAIIWRDETDYTYTLPAASPSTLGGVKIGNNINVSEDGTISVSDQAAVTDRITSGSTSPVTSGAVYTALQGKQDTIPSYVSTVNGQSGAVTIPVVKEYTLTTSTALLDLTAQNSCYHLTGTISLTVNAPASGSYCSLIDVTFGTQGELSVDMDEGFSYIGNAPTFASGERWEISIRNGVVVCGKVTSNA